VVHAPLSWAMQQYMEGSRCSSSVKLSSVSKQGTMTWLQSAAVSAAPSAAASVAKRNLALAVMRDSIGFGVFFTSFEAVKDHFRARFAQQVRNEYLIMTWPLSSYIVAGTISGVCLHFITFPFERLRRCPATVRITSVMQRKYLFRGLGAHLTQTMLLAGVAFVAYQMTLDKLERDANRVLQAGIKKTFESKSSADHHIHKPKYE